MANQTRVFQVQRLDNISRVQGEIEHIANFGTFLAVAIAGKQRRIEVIFLRKLFQKRIARQHAARAVQKYHRHSASTLVIADGNAWCSDGFELESHLKSPPSQARPLPSANFPVSPA